MKTKNNSGFTLIELIVVLGIIGIIMLMLSQLVLINIQAFQKIDSNTELQYQGQYAMGFMGNKIMESSSIEKIFNTKNTDITNQNCIDKVQISKAVFFKNNKKNKTNLEIFEAKHNKLFHGLADLPHRSATTEFASYIKEVWMQPFPIGVKFSDAKAVQITILLQKNEYDMEISNSFYLRNHNRRNQ